MMSKMCHICVTVLSLAISTLIIHGAEITWTNVAQDGNWHNPQNWSANTVPQAGDAVFFKEVGGTLNIVQNTTVQQIRVSGAVHPQINLASGITLTISNSGSRGITLDGGDLTINGPGVVNHSTSTGLNFLDHHVHAGYTLTYNAKISGNIGFENYLEEQYRPGGTVVMGNPQNDFYLDYLVRSGYTVIVSQLAPRGNPSSLGAGHQIYLRDSSTLRYIGAGSMCDRDINLEGGSTVVGFGGSIEQAGTGELLFTGSVKSIDNNAQILTLKGDSATPAILQGEISNGDKGSIAINKEGSGTWILSGNNTFSGDITLRDGTLVLNNSTAAGRAKVIHLQDAGHLALNTAGADTFALQLPTLKVNTASGVLSIPAANNASTVTIKELVVQGHLTINAPELGSAANRIFVANLTPGLVGSWLSVNGQIALYDAANGLVPTTLSTVGVPTRGAVLPDNANLRAVIDRVGSGGELTLAEDFTRLYTLTQTEGADTATVALGGQILQLDQLAIAPTGAALTLGATSTNSGVLLPFSQHTTPIVHDTSAIQALEPWIWYDPADSSTVLLDNGRIIRLENKGLAGVTCDAEPLGRDAPRLVDLPEAHSMWPMIKIATTAEGLTSASHCGVSGSQPRTLIAVISHDSGKRNIISIGGASHRTSFEVFPFPDRTRFGTYGGANSDIDVPVEPPAFPSVLSMWNNVNDNPHATQGFVNGVGSHILAAGDLLETKATPLHLGHRDGVGSDDYRGQIGEVLFFKRKLSTTEREVVEAYLMAKWQQKSPTSHLTLANFSAAPLTLNTPIVESIYTAPGAIHKCGTGAVVMQGSAALTPMPDHIYRPYRGTTTIEEGVLELAAQAQLGDGTHAGDIINHGTLHITSAASQILSGNLSGSGNLVRSQTSTPLRNYAHEEYLNTAPQIIITGERLTNLFAIEGALGGGYAGTVALQNMALPFYLRNDGKVATVQIQFFDGTYTKCCKVELRQVGADITAHVLYAKNATGNAYNTNFDNTGNTQTVAGSEAGNGYGIRYLALNFSDHLLTLSGQNSFSGGLLLDGTRMLVLQRDDALPARGGIVVTNGAELRLSVSGLTSASEAAVGGLNPITVHNSRLTIDGRFNGGAARPITIDGGTMSFTTLDNNDSGNYINHLTLANGASVEGYQMRLGHVVEARTWVRGTAPSTILSGLSLVRHSQDLPWLVDVADVTTDSAPDLIIRGALRDYPGHSGLSLKKIGDGTLALAATQNTSKLSYIVSEGTLRLEKATAVNTDSAIRLEGGNLELGQEDYTLGMLTLAADSVLQLQNGTLSFQASESRNWEPGATLVLEGKLLKRQVRFGENRHGLSKAQLDAIDYGKRLLGLDGDGYLYIPSMVILLK